MVFRQTRLPLYITSITITSITSLAPLIAPSSAFAFNALAAATTPGNAPILSYKVEPSGILFRVPSRGCTSKAQFGVERITDKPLTVRLIRLRPDICGGNAPDGASIKFSYGEIGARGIPNGEPAIIVVNEMLGD